MLQLHSHLDDKPISSCIHGNGPKQQKVLASNAYSHTFVLIHKHRHARGIIVFQGIGEGGGDLASSPGSSQLFNVAR